MAFELPEPNLNEQTPYSLVGEAIAKEGMADLLEEHLLSLVAPTLEEPGCVAYKIHRDRANPNRFVFYEAWSTKATLEAHLQMPYIQKFLAEHDRYVAQPMHVTWLQMVSAQ